MGKAVKTATGAGRGFLDPLGMTGNNPLASALGIGGEQGEYFQGTTENLPLAEIAARNAVLSKGGVNDALAQYGQGKMSLADALKASGLQGVQQDELRNLIASDPMAGSQFATEQVQNNAILGQLFGKGGALERTLGEEADLAKRGFSLQPEDHEAYGQISGQIARQFANEESDLAQALAARGLAAAPSGAAGVEYSGLMGNRNERLKQAQLQIANDRMNKTVERRAQLQQYSAQLGNQGANAIQDQFGRQMQGVQQKRNNLNAAAELTNASNSIKNNADLASMQDKREAKGKTFMQALGAGLLSSGANIGSAPGKFASSAAGKGGEAYGAGMSK